MEVCTSCYASGDGQCLHGSKSSGSTYVPNRLTASLRAMQSKQGELTYI